MNWSSDPPRISGWWFVGESPNVLRLYVALVEVRQFRRKWQWSLLNRPRWHSTDDYPKYKWAGPIDSPSLENFNKAK